MTDVIKKEQVKTDRLTISYLTGGASDAVPLILLHGNVSSNIFWEDSLVELSKTYRVFAPDLRGYGETEPLPVSVERGVKDWSDDLDSFLSALEINQQIHLLGWSLGGGVTMQFALDHAKKIRSMILVNPVSPFGFGGTMGVDGTPCFPNYSGTGGGTVNPDFLARLKSKDTSEEDPNSPKNVLNQFYFKPPFRLSKEKEDALVFSMLSTNTADGFYPGSFEACSEWPGIAPGNKGINNAISPKYFNVSAIVDITPKFPILWIRGANDLIVSDSSMFDLGFLGQNNYIEGWPGEKVFPPQPMVSQTRSVLNTYREKGGDFQELVIEEAGHSPHIEQPEVFLQGVREFTASSSQ